MNFITERVCFEELEPEELLETDISLHPCIWVFILEAGSNAVQYLCDASEYDGVNRETKFVTACAELPLSQARDDGKGRGMR
jgi:hypothetical protein